jgi:5-methylcytosine-specific restriction enzyme subunit McrC
MLIEMLCCLQTFRHLQTEHAKLQARHMRLLELFIAEFLSAVSRIVKRGLRGGYAARQDNLATLRGKLQISQHLRRNLVHADRFFTEHDEFTTNRPENRLLHFALR